MPGNQLAGETSPYLLQHARNPVQWRPWGEAALAEARELDRPIFLSIGYATCHWCHVMAHESFEDDDVAELLNRWFVPVKVDREERPDVDSVYMSVCQMMTGHGGWPLTVVLTPELRPFFSGTYFPRETRGGRIGMLDLLPRIAGIWERSRSEVEESADRITEVLRASAEVTPGTAPGRQEVDGAVRHLAGRFDAENGGFGTAPKFPSPHQLTFLLRVREAGGGEPGEKRLLEMVTRTLEAMAAGGIHDQLGGGFHRYSTDAAWRLPHFEKMLYDQALIALAYTEAHQVTGERLFADVATTTLDYVVGELTDETGGLHSAEDADSEGEEGKYYVWTWDELCDVLGEGPEFEAAVRWFGVTRAGNFRDEATGARTGANVLLGAAEAPEQDGLREIRERLRQARAARRRPARDDKILTDWNGLAAAALARAGAALARDDYVAAAENAAGFVLENAVDAEGDLQHVWRAGVAGVPAMADDYASLALGCLEIYAATHTPRWLETALDLATELVERFEAPGGGFFQVAAGASEPLVRVIESTDGALPSANSVGIDVLLRLARLTGRVELEGAAFSALGALGPRVRAAPAAHTALLSAVLFAEGPTAEVAIVEGTDRSDVAAWTSPLRQGFHPRLVHLLMRSDPAEREALARIAPFTADMQAVDGCTTGYLCRDHACGLPQTDLDAFLDAVSGI